MSSAIYANMLSHPYVPVAPNEEACALVPAHVRWSCDDAFTSELRKEWARWRLESQGAEGAIGLNCVVACGNLRAAIYNGFIAVVPLEADSAELESAVHSVVSSAAVRLVQGKQMGLADGGSIEDLSGEEEAIRTLRLALVEGDICDGRVDGSIERNRVVFLRSADFSLAAPVWPGR